MCKNMTTILIFVQHFTVFGALSLSHLIFLTILPNNFHDLCFQMRKPKLSKSHRGAPRSSDQPGEELEPDLRSHDSLLKGNEWHAIWQPSSVVSILLQHEDSFFFSEIVAVLQMRRVVILGFSQPEKFIVEKRPGLQHSWKGDRHYLHSWQAILGIQIDIQTSGNNSAAHGQVTTCWDHTARAAQRRIHLRSPPS